MQMYTTKYSFNTIITPISINTNIEHQALMYTAANTKYNINTTWLRVTEPCQLLLVSQFLLVSTKHSNQ